MPMFSVGSQRALARNKSAWAAVIRSLAIAISRGRAFASCIATGRLIGKEGSTSSVLLTTESLGTIP